MIHGSRISMRPATEVDRRAIYTWLVSSDVTPSMMGPPTYPDVLLPTWDEFCRDYAAHFFDGSRPDRARSFVVEVGGEPVGHINYDGLDADRSIAELDIWMRSRALCGHGYGTDAMIALARHMREQFAVKSLIVRPSRRNQRAVRAFEKAGFRPSTLSAAEQERSYGAGDYVDTITLVRRMFQ